MGLKERRYQKQKEALLDQIENGKQFHLTPEFEKDQDVLSLLGEKIKKGLRDYKKYYEILPKALKEDPTVYLGYFNNHTKDVPIGTHTKMVSRDEEITVTSYAHSHILDLPETLKSDKDFILKTLDILKSSYTNFSYDHYKIQDPALSEYYYRYMSNELKNDADIAIAILTAHPNKNNLNHMPKTFVSNEKFMIEAGKINIAYLENLPKELATEEFYIKLFESIVADIEKQHYGEKYNSFLGSYVDTPLVNDFLQSIPQNLLANKEFVKKLIDIDPIAYRVIGRTQEKDQKEITTYALDNSVPLLYDLAPYIPQNLRTVEFLHDFLLVDAFYSKDEIGKYNNKELSLKVGNDAKLFSLLKLCKEDAADNKKFIIEMIEAGGPEVYLLASDKLKNDLEVALTACSFVQPNEKNGELEKSDLIKYLPQSMCENPEFFIRAAAKSNYDFSFWFPKQQQTNVKYLIESVNLNPEKFLSCAPALSEKDIILLKQLIEHAFDLEEERYFGKKVKQNKKSTKKETVKTAAPEENADENAAE